MNTCLSSGVIELYPRGLMNWCMGVLEEFRMDGKTAVVTGGASGIGKAFAEAMAEAGADVVIGDIDAEGARETADGIREGTGSEAVAFEVDVSEKDQVDGFIGEAVDRFGAIDACFVNAGIAELESSLRSYEKDQWDRVIGVNLTGMFLTGRAAAEAMEDGGSIVFTSSIYGLVGDDTIGLYAYTASKGGVVQLTKTMANDLAPDVRVNAIAPGPVRTSIGHGFMKEDAPGMESVQEEIKRKTPLDRLAQPEDMKGMALYLASPASSFCTGYVYAVDGGWTSR